MTAILSTELTPGRHELTEEVRLTLIKIIRY